MSVGKECPKKNNTLPKRRSTTCDPKVDTLTQNVRKCDTGHCSSTASRRYHQKSHVTHPSFLITPTMIVECPSPCSGSWAMMLRYEVSYPTLCLLQPHLTYPTSANNVCDCHWLANDDCLPFPPSFTTDEGTTKEGMAKTTPEHRYNPNHEE